MSSLTEVEVERVHECGHASPVTVAGGFAVLVPCATDDWEIEVMASKAKAEECGKYYWGDSFGGELS